MESELQQQYALDFAADNECALAPLVGERFPAYDLVVVNLRLPICLVPGCDGVLYADFPSREAL